MLTAPVTWLKHCRYGVKPYSVNQLAGNTHYIKRLATLRLAQNNSGHLITAI